MLQVGSRLARDLGVFILKALRYLQQSKETLPAHVDAVAVLEEVYDVLWNPQVETGLDFVRAASLEDRPDHSQCTALACLLEVWTIKSAQAFCDWDQLVVVGSGTAHWN